MATGLNFINEIAPIVKMTCQKYQLKASVCIAQAILESNWGRNRIGLYNIFGRKWNKNGRFIEVPTSEYVKGKWIKIYAKFRDYDSLNEAIDSYCMLISHAPYRLDKTSLESYVTSLGKVYATDPKYAQSLLSLIHQYNLEQYDK